MMTEHDDDADSDADAAHDVEKMKMNTKAAMLMVKLMATVNGKLYIVNGKR